MDVCPLQVVNVLRSQLAKLDEVKKERETLEGEIKSVTFDMSTTFLTALAQDGLVNEEQLSLSNLDQLYSAYNQRVQASLRTQEELLGQVQVRKQKVHFLQSVKTHVVQTNNVQSKAQMQFFAFNYCQRLTTQPVIFLQTSHQEFSSLKQSNTEANQREEVLKKLASAHDSYVEISSNLREGTKVLPSAQQQHTRISCTAVMHMQSETFYVKAAVLFLSPFSPLSSTTT